MTSQQADFTHSAKEVKSEISLFTGTPLADYIYRNIFRLDDAGRVNSASCAPFK